MTSTLDTSSAPQPALPKTRNPGPWTPHSIPSNVPSWYTGTTINQNTLTGMASIPMQTAPSALTLIVRFYPNANCPICPYTDSALHILSGCQHTNKMRNMIIKRHSMASVLIVQALQRDHTCGANQIAYTDIGSADKLSEQGLDLRNTANRKEKKNYAGSENHSPR